MDYLFIAPFPVDDVHTGNSLPVKLIHDQLILKGFSVKILNLNKRRTSTFRNSIIRIFQIFNLFVNVFLLSNKQFKGVYLTIAESKFGIVRDLIIYIILKKKINKVNIHLLGGKNLDIIFEKKSIIYQIYKFYSKKFNSIIVEGSVQKKTFLKLGDLNNIHIVPNFSEDYLYSSLEKIKIKFDNCNKIKILFLSNMLEGKGYIELAKAIVNLPEKYFNKFEIDFIGNILNEKDLFLSIVKKVTNIRVHGPLYGLDKKKYFEEAHIFCLPTYYPFEGQPFSIIEAYASGCYVITCEHSGIPQIFNNYENGVYAVQKSYESLTKILIDIADCLIDIKSVAINNFNLAKSEYNSQKFITKILYALNEN